MKLKPRRLAGVFLVLSLFGTLLAILVGLTSVKVVIVAVAMTAIIFVWSALAVSFLFD